MECVTGGDTLVGHEARRYGVRAYDGPPDLLPLEGVSALLLLSDRGIPSWIKTWGAVLEAWLAAAAASCTPTRRY